nr:hypothetical protein [uncultured Roseateles sp.]
MARSRLALLALLLAAGAVANPPSRRELGGFSLQLPAGVTQQAGGIDSHAGRLVGAALQIDYDLGLNADPLLAREGISGREERAVTIDGRPARLVSWRVEQPAPVRHFVGLHLPQVGESVMGPLGLTLLAQARDATALAEARAILLSLRLTTPVASPR